MLSDAEARTPAMVEATRILVETESPSSDVASCGRVLDVASGLLSDATGHAPCIGESKGKPYLLWGSATPRVLLLGHLDTVWPVGTLERLPWTCDGERMTGPGVFDMKVGVVQALTALSMLGLGSDDGVSLLITTDEEISSEAGRPVIEQCAAAADAVLVFEPSIDGDLKTARKGTSWYDVEFRGRASHAGLDPEKGVNALVEAAALVTASIGFADAERGTTVTPTLARAGVTSNTVPDRAEITIDVRAWSYDEQARVDSLIRGWALGHPDASMSIMGGGINRPAMEPAMAAPLMERVVRLAAELGLQPIGDRAVGGASDGNFTAALGIPTIDGLGAVGDGAHADHEWASVRHLAERTALATALIDDILKAPR